MESIQAVKQATPPKGKDYSEDIYNRCLGQSFKIEHDRKLLAKIEGWRTRQELGDAMPAWNRWCEFQITLTSGDIVVVVHDPHWLTRNESHIEFHGPVTSTGYRSLFVNPYADKSMPLEEFARQYANELRIEAEAEFKKQQRKGKKYVFQKSNSTRN